MVKSHLLMAFGTVALLGAGFSSAALAAPDLETADAGGVHASSCDAGPGYVSKNATRILELLQSKGVKASRVDQWGACVQAFVTNANGSQSIELFTPYTLVPVTGA